MLINTKRPSQPRWAEQRTNCGKQIQDCESQSWAEVFDSQRKAMQNVRSPPCCVP